MYENEFRKTDEKQESKNLLKLFGHLGQIVGSLVYSNYWVKLRRQTYNEAFNAVYPYSNSIPDPTLSYHPPHLVLLGLVPTMIGNMVSSFLIGKYWWKKNKKTWIHLIIPSLISLISIGFASLYYLNRSPVVQLGDSILYNVHSDPQRPSKLGP